MRNNGSTVKERYVFRAADFYTLLETQNYRCPYSGRELTPANCIAEHRLPLRKAGKHEAVNIVLVDNEIGYLKRYLTDAQVLNLAKDIVKTIGKKGSTNGVA